MDNNSDDQLLIMQDKIEPNRKNSYEKINNITEDLTAMIASMMDQIKISRSSPYKEGFYKGSGSYHCGHG